MITNFTKVFNTIKLRAFILSIVLILLNTINIFAIDDGIYLVPTTTYYINPETGEVDDIGSGNTALGEAMTRSALGETALLEVENGKIYLTFRLNLISNISNIKISTQSSKGGSYSTVSTTIKAENYSEDYADYRFEVKDLDYYIGLEFYVAPMGRTVKFYASVDESKAVAGSGDFVTSIKVSSSNSSTTSEDTNNTTTSEESTSSSSDLDTTSSTEQQTTTTNNATTSTETTATEQSSSTTSSTKQQSTDTTSSSTSTNSQSSTSTQTTNSTSSSSTSSLTNEETSSNENQESTQEDIDNTTETISSQEEVSQDTENEEETDIITSDKEDNSENEEVVSVSSTTNSTGNKSSLSSSTGSSSLIIILVFIILIAIFVWLAIKFGKKGN